MCVSTTMDDINSRSLQVYEEASKDVDLFEGRQLDLVGAASGYGSYCPEGIPLEQAICLLLAAFALSFGILWTALTVATGGRRKKRFLESDTTFLEDLQDKSSDLLWWGTCTRVLNSPSFSSCCCCCCLVSVSTYNANNGFGSPPVWPDWAIFCTLGNFTKAFGNNDFAQIFHILRQFL